MKKRPVTTLFMLSSVDGKISTGNSDLLDVDSDYPAMYNFHFVTLFPTAKNALITLPTTLYG